MIWTPRKWSHSRDAAQWWTPCLESRSEGPWPSKLNPCVHRPAQNEHMNERKEGRAWKKGQQTTWSPDSQGPSSSARRLSQGLAAAGLAFFRQQVAPEPSCLSSCAASTVCLSSPACPGASLQQTFHFVPGCPWLSVQTPPPATEDKFLPRRPLPHSGIDFRTPAPTSPCRSSRPAPTAGTKGCRFIPWPEIEFL